MEFGGRGLNQAALDQRTRDSPQSNDPEDFPHRGLHGDWRDPYGEYGEHRSPELDAPHGLWQGPLHEPAPPVPHDTSSNGPRRSSSIR